MNRFLFFLVIFGLFLNSVAAYGIGVSPDRIIFSDIVMGKQYEQSFFVFNPSDQVMACSLNIPLNVSVWFSASCADDCVILPKSHVPCTARVMFLQTLDAEKYDFELEVGFVLPKEDGVMILPKLGIPISIASLTQKTEEKKSLEMPSFSAMAVAKIPTSKKWFFPALFAVVFMMYLGYEWWKKKNRKTPPQNIMVDV